MFFSYVVYDTVEVEPVYFAPLVTSSNNNSGSRAAASSSSSPSSSSSSTTHATEAASPYVARYDEVLVHRLTERYVGRVLPRHGLCVAIGDVLEYSHSTVKGLGASAWLAATFEVCVFAPTPGTRMRARIAAQSPHGIALRVDFFACPFHVPATRLVHGTRYDAVTSTWYLPLCDDDDDDEAADKNDNDNNNDDDHAAMQRNYYMDGEEVVVRIDACIVRSEDDVRREAAGGDADATATPPLPPMELRGSFVGDGLGPTAWFE